MGLKIYIVGHYQAIITTKPTTPVLVRIMPVERSLMYFEDDDKSPVVYFKARFLAFPPIPNLPLKTTLAPKHLLSCN